MFIRAYNEWTSEFCSASPKRLLGLGFLPINDVEAAVEELYNCAKLGLKGVQFQAFDAEKRLFDQVWDPLWSAAEETGLPVHFHVGGGQWSTKGEKPPGRGAQTASTTVAPIQLDEVLAEVVLSGMLYRHPKIKAVLGESSIGWIPFVLHRMDWEYDVRVNKGRGGDAGYEAIGLLQAADVRDVPERPHRREAAGVRGRGQRHVGVGLSPRRFRVAVFPRDGGEGHRGRRRGQLTKGDLRQRLEALPGRIITVDTWREHGTFWH